MRLTDHSPLGCNINLCRKGVVRLPKADNGSTLGGIVVLIVAVELPFTGCILGEEPIHLSIIK
jgi:hypothetical protein